MTANQTALRGNRSSGRFRDWRRGKSRAGERTGRARPGMMEFNKESDYAGRKSASKRIDVTLMNRSQSPAARPRSGSPLSLPRGFDRQDKPIQLRAPVKRIPRGARGPTRTTIAGTEIKWNTTMTARARELPGVMCNNYTAHSYYKLVIISDAYAMRMRCARDFPLQFVRRDGLKSSIGLYDVP